MNNEQPGVPRPQPRQQMGLNDMQLWQQQLMYRQFQELQRQQQLQQLDQQSRQQNSLNQLSGIAKQSPDQLSALVNGASMHDAASYWPRELGGGDSKTPSTSQMHMVGSLNWVQHSGVTSMQSFPGGLMLPQDQGHASNSVGFPSQQFEQPFYGAPVAGTRGNLSQHPSFQGISHGNADVSAKLGNNQVEKQMVQPAAFNSFQIAQPPVFPDQHCTQDGASVSKEGLNEKILFGPVPVPTLPNGTFSENFQQVSQFQRNALAPEFLGRKDSDGWMGNLQEKTVAQVAPAQGVVSLDPTEEKILFGSDDGIWGAFGRTSSLNGGYVQSNQFDNHLNACPSIQSGSWSALMQSAVAETSSDTGPQDEWSGLSFQKPDLSTGNHPLPLDDNGKQPASWIDKNLQTASSVVSRPFPFFDNANSNPGSRSIPGFQQTNAEYAFQGAERVRMNAFHESVPRLPEEVSKPPVEGNHQVQKSTHLEKTLEGVSERRIHEQSHGTVDSKHMGLNAQVMQDSLVHQQNMSSYNTGSQSSHKPNAWNINEALSPNGNGTMRTCDSQNHAQNNDKKQAMLIEGDHGGGMWKAEGNFMGISFPNASDRLEQVKSGKSSPQVHSETILQNSRTSNINQETNQQIRHDSKLEYGKYVNVDSSIKYDGNENVSKFPHQTRKSLQAQESSYNNTYRGLVETEACDSKQGSYSSAHPQSNQFSITEGGTRDDAWLRRSDPHDVAGNNHNSSGQGASQAVMGGLGRIDQGYYGQSRPSDNAVLDKPADTAKEHMPDFLRDAKGEIEVPSRSLNPGRSEHIMSASFHGSGSSYTPNRTQPSQNMLELLNKVDQSRDGKYTTHLGSSEHKASQMPELVASAQSVTHHQSQSSAVQGFGLQLALPSERISNMNHALSLQNSPQISDDVNAARFDETSQRERNQSIISGQTGIEARQSIDGNSFPTVTLGSYPNNQRQEQQFPSTSGPIDLSLQGRLASHVRQARDSSDGAADNSPRASLPGFYSRIPPFNFPSSAGPIASAQSYSGSAGHNQNPVMLDMSQQGALPLKPHNIWPNVATQQHLSGRPSNNVPPSFFQPNQPATSSLEATSRAPQKADCQAKGGSFPPEFASCSVNAQQFAYREGQPFKDNCSQQMPLGIDLAPGTTRESQGQDPVSQKYSEATCSTSSSSAAIHPDHQLGRGEEAQERLVIHSEHASVSNKDTSDHDTEAFSHSLKPSDAQQRNYSLLHQMHAMKDVEPDPTRMSMKRLKGADFSAAAQVQHFAYGYGRMARDPVDELNVAAQHPSFAPVDSRMLCFSSGRNEDLNKNASFQPHARDKQIEIFGQNDPQNSSNHPGMASMPSHRVNENPQINPQMAPSWFEKYGTYKNGQILAMHGELDSSKTNAKVAAQQFFFGNASESSSQTHSGVERLNASNASQVGNIWQTQGSATPAKEHLSAPYPLPNVEDSAITGSKKRKIMELDPPWHREVSHRLQSISMAELDWAQASNRQIEKVEDDVEMFEDGMRMPYQRRRLILASQLMQQLFRSIPAAVLSADATLGHENVTYFSAKLALEDACTGVDSHIHSIGRNVLSEKPKTSETVGDQFLSKVVEGFIGRAKKLENDLLRPEQKASILDIRVECQDLERFAIINRFARFHGRGNAPDIAGSSSSGATIHRTHPQRYVTAHPLPRNLPEGSPCLSL